ncbi:hypothetical protein H4Q26_006703 [Puccinia striiformis f. sp. tritici PST-130]|nr:hypothetical protein H4Q26_006703 [Puccinia striiformis f. sp. tritici PST-130]
MLQTSDVSWPFSQSHSLLVNTTSNRPTFDVKRLRDVRFAFAADIANVNQNGGVRSTFGVKRHPTSPHVTQTFAGGRRPFAGSVRRTARPIRMTPEENQNLINHYLTLVKQQRADNPPPPPFVDPLTSNERLDRIIKNVLADREAELDHRIFFNQSLRDYRSDKRMQTITRRDLLFKFMVHVTNELIKDPRPTVHSKDFDAVTFKKRFEALEKALNNDRLNSPQEKKNAAVFNARFEEYKAALIQAQEVEVQATQKVTGNVHLDKHLAQTPITEKPVDKKNKATKKKSCHLEPTLKRITPKRALPVISDSESEAGISIDHPSSPILERIASKPELSILSDSEDELDEAKQERELTYKSLLCLPGPIIPTLNPSTLIQNDEPSKLDEPIKVLKTPKGTTKHPGSLGIIREPLSSDESRASSEMESESEDEIPEAEIIRILIKKQVKIHARYLKATSNDDKKLILDQAQQNQLVLQKLIPNKEIESYVNGWNPWVEKKKVFPAPPKNKKRPKSDKRNQPRQSGSNRPDQTHSNYNRDQTRSTNSRNRTHSNMSRGQGRSNNNSRQTHSNQNNKRYREESEDLEDPARWKEVHRATAIMSSLSTINHNITTLESNLDVNTTKILRTVEKCYIKSAKTSSEISDQLNNSADIMEKLEQSEASILSNVKQDLITEVRVYVQKEVETLTNTVTTSFEGIMSQLRNMEQNSNDKFNNLQRDIVEIKKKSFLWTIELLRQNQTG